jgi:Lyzozyme M1 (1,4-beta-N-acetylmuramidase)
VSFDGLDGMNVSDVENDPELCALLDDPTFYRYYGIDDDGVIFELQPDADDVDTFIAEADANAEGIEDVDRIETKGDVSAMGGGVTGIGKGQTPAKYSKHNRYNCIDISWWQGKLSDDSWQKIKGAGVTHVIVRCGYSTLRSGEHNMDSTFSNNLNRAYKAGLKVGVYYYSTAVSPAEAKSEAKYVVSVIKNYRDKITLPVAFDYETGGRLTSKVMKSVGTESCKAFCDKIAAEGYTPMVYANYNTLTKFIDHKTLQSKYKIWLANYTTNGAATTYEGDYWMWQYSSLGRVNGIKKAVDINYIFEPKDKPSTDTGSKPKGYKATVTCKMNYRTGPSKNKKVVGTYKKGKKVYIKKFKGNWAKMTNGYWINRSHLKYKAKTKEAVNYRTGPGTGYELVGTYKKGKKITIVKVRNGWAKMKNGYWLAVKYTKPRK